MAKRNRDDPVGETFRNASRAGDGFSDWRRLLIIVAVIWVAVVALLFLFGWPAAFRNGWLPGTGA